MPEEIGEGLRFGKYEIGPLLGRGGCGEVWKAWDAELKRWTALKFLMGADPLEAARFRREAQTAARLTHPNIASVYEAGEIDGRPYIALQFVDGPSLQRFPRNDRRRLVGIVREAALAVHFAHERGVIHRDLKPANIMVESRISNSESRKESAVIRDSKCEIRVFVMDFGLAKSTSVDSSLSVSGAILGTPAYMSPEQARGEAVDARSDVYSLGAALYEILTGRPPFEGTNVYDLLDKVARRDPARTGLDRDLETIILKCLEKDAARRYATARELAEDLERWLQGAAILAHSPSALYRFGKMLRRRKTVVAAAAVGLVAAAAALAGLLRERAEKEAVKELGALWMEVVVEKQALHNAASDPARIRARISDALGRVDDFISRHPRMPQGHYIRARGRLYLDDLHGAEKDLENAVAINPDFAPGHALLARVKIERHLQGLYGVTGSRRRDLRPLLEEAKLHFQRGWAEGGDRHAVQRWGLPRTREDGITDVLLRAFWTAFMEGDLKSAARMLEEANDREEAPELWSFLGNLVTDEAQRILCQDRALRLMPHYAKAYLDRGNARQGQGDREGAMADYRRALAVNPRMAYAWFNLASARQDAGDIEGAIRDYDRAIDHAPDFAKAYVNRGNAHSDLADYEDALADFARALELDPRLPQAYMNRAVVRSKMGAMDAALGDATQALAIDPDYAEGHYNRGLLRKSAGDRKGALDDLNAAIRIDSAHADAHLTRGSLRDGLGDPSGAREDFDRAIEIDPKLARAWSNRAHLNLQAGDNAGAVADATKAIELDPNLAEPLVHRGMARHLDGNARSAVEDLEKATRLAPYMAVAWYQLGRARMSAGDLERAERDFTRAVETNAKMADAHAMRAMVRHLLGDAEGALEDCDKAIWLDPKHAEAYANRSQLLLQQGEFALAEEDGSKAVELAPHLPEAYVNRGCARAELKRHALAAADFEQALQLAPADWPHRAQVETWLRESRGRQ